MSRRSVGAVGLNDRYVAPVKGNLEMLNLDVSCSGCCCPDTGTYVASDTLKENIHYYSVARDESPSLDKYTKE